MYINLNKKHLKNTMKKANKECIEDWGEDEGKDTLLYGDLNDTIENIEFNKGILDVSFSNELGYFSFDLDIDDDLAFEIIEYMKSKGREIKRLINLVD